MNGRRARSACLLVVILSLVACGTGPPAEASETVARWNFSRHNDLNFDDLPDGWKRVEGPGYPRYLKFAIEPTDAEHASRMRAIDARLLETWQEARRYMPRLPALPPSLADLLVDRSLLAELDGGALQVISPRIEVLTDYSYRLRLRIRTEGLKHNRAWAELVFYDSAGRELERTASEPLSGSTEWAVAQVGPQAPPPGAVAADVRLRLEPGMRPDMTGAAGFDDVHIDRLPRIRTESDQPLGIYAAGARPEIRCVISGLPSEVASIQFSLCDAADHELQRQTLSIRSTSASGPSARLLSSRSANAASPPTIGRSSSAAGRSSARRSLASRSPRRGGYGGQARWQLPPLEPGFYRVKVDLVDYSEEEFDIDQTLAVVSDLPSGTGPFGWSLASPNRPQFPTNSLPQWLAECRVSWVKYPCWIAPDNPAAVDDLARLFRRLKDRHIEPVGVLATPPAEQLEPLGVEATDPAALLFRDQTSWRPLLEPVMARLTPEVRWWQLGGERDYSFLGRTQLTQLIEGIRIGLQGYGNPIQIVISWPWLEKLPPESAQSWKTVCLSDAIEPTAAEITTYMEALAKPEAEKPLGEDEEERTADSASEVAETNRTQRPWILLDPLAVDRYPRTERIRDLILRMLAVRQQHIPAAFVSDPFDPRLGLLRADGSPDEMLLPWRTAAAMLGPLRPAGSLELPGGSDNVLMLDDSRAVLVLWSDSPRTETLFLGDEVTEIDAWGRAQKVDQVTVAGRPQQRIAVGPQPKYIVGLDRTVALWRLNVQLAPERLDSLLGREQTVNLQFQNPSSQLLNGSYRVRGPQAWSVDRFSRTFTAEPHQERDEPFQLVLRSNATIGRQPVEIDFELEGDRHRRFTVWRHMEIGPEDVQIEATTRLLADGRLLVRQELSVASATPQRFDCYIYAPGRQRERRGVTVPGGSKVRQEFYLENGRELIGQDMLLRADQRGSGRTLNYPFTAQR